MNERSLMTGSETMLYSPYRIGVRDPRAIKAGSSVWPASLTYFSTQNIVAYIPDEALGRFRYELSLFIPNASKADLPHSFHVNGNCFAEFATVPIGTTLKAQVPPSLLTAGQNTFVISNGAVNCWCNWSYRIDVKKLHSLFMSFR